MITVKSSPLKNYVRQFDKSVVIFGSPTCSACKKVTEIVIPLLEQVHTDVEFMFMDGDKFEGTADYYNIEYYPTLVYTPFLPARTHIWIPTRMGVIT
jgi:thiol-disulfide isomerase/thioredoxin